jgi:uncharacterized membrane protein YfcA
MFPDLPLLAWGIVLLAGFGTGLGKAGFGGVGMLAMLLMAMVFPPRASTGIILPMLIAADLLAVHRFRQFTVWRHVRRLLPTAGAGVLLGWWIMPRVPETAFGPLIGWIILFMILLLVLMRTLPRLRNITLERQSLLVPTGLLTGITTMLANAAGPVATLYLLACRLPKLEFVGTGAWFFLLINVFKVPFSIHLGLLNTQSLILTLAAFPAILGGILLGRWLLDKISQRLFEILLLLFAAAGALRLILA